jgi:excisionase family DNA binding protein
MPRLDDYLTIKDAAEYLGVSVNTLRNWGRDARIEEYRHPINNYRLYRQVDLDKVICQLEASVSSPVKRPR